MSDANHVEMEALSGTSGKKARQRRLSLIRDKKRGRNKENEGLNVFYILYWFIIN